jgi:hypothetical protein
MPHFALRGLLASWLAAVATLGGCLPKDTRPPPALVRVTATPSPATQAGKLETDDGWTITFDRVLLAIGRVSLDGNHCSTYSEARYSRVLTLVGAPSAQKISDSYALGQCDFGFGVSTADVDALLGVGASAADLGLLRTAGSDRYAGTSGAVLLVQGSARKGSETERFDWSFRSRMRYRECSSIVDGQQLRGLDLPQDAELDVDIELHAEALFRTSLDPTVTTLGFDTLASADALVGNHDGELTLDELGALPLSDAQLGGGFGVADAGAPEWLTLEDYVYLGAAPTIARYRGSGTCTLPSMQND